MITTTTAAERKYENARNRPAYPVPGAAGYTIQPVVDRVAYPANGNVHNPTITFYYLLKLDDRLVDHFAREREARAAARSNDYATD